MARYARDAFVSTNKKEREIAYCQQVVGRMNHDDGTDYAVESAPEEPTDVIFKSRSGKYPDRAIQVVTAGPSLRTDRRNIQNFERALSDCIRRNGVDEGLILTLALTPQAMCSKRPRHIELVCKLIIKNLEQGCFALTPNELRKNAPAVYSVVRYIGGIPCPGSNRILWDVLTFQDILSATRDPGPWVRDAISRKAKKYKPEDVACLVLVVGLPMFLKSSGEAHLRQAFPNPSQLPFNQVWVSSWDGRAIRLKP